MLKVINLYVLREIFSRAEVKLSVMAQMLYINCLTHYFSDKDATTENAYGFDMAHSDFPDYKKYEKHLQELHKAELIVINKTSITFNNVWGQHIDRSLLDLSDSKLEPSPTFFRLKDKVYYQKISTFAFENFQSFLEAWEMKNTEVSINEVFEKMDVDYLGYDFRDHNHLKNSFKATYEKIRREQKFEKKNPETKDYLQY